MLIDQRRNQSIRKGSIVGDNKRQNDFRETRKWDELVFVLVYLAEIYYWHLHGWLFWNLFTGGLNEREEVMYEVLHLNSDPGYTLSSLIYKWECGMDFIECKPLLGTYLSSLV